MFSRKYRLLSINFGDQYETRHIIGRFLRIVWIQFSLQSHWKSPFNWLETRESLFKHMEGSGNL